MCLLEELKALADKTRLQIIQMLLSHDFCVGALAHKLTLSEATVSGHLQILRKAGLIKGEKKGYFVHYKVEQSKLREIADKLYQLSFLTQSGSTCCNQQKEFFGDKEGGKIE